MEDIYQQIFTRSFSEKLRLSLGSGESLESYLDPSFAVPADATLQSTLEVVSQPPELIGTVEADIEDSIKLYNYLHNLDATQASDKRLWIYLSHVTFRQYVQKRWPITASESDLKFNDDTRRKAISFVAEHWFHGGSARSLRRHALARLWWPVHLTVAPWEKDPEYFSTLVNEDRFIYTRVLFSMQDIYQQILERNLGHSQRLLIALLEYIRRNPEIKRQSYRDVIMEVNLVLGYRKISTLSFEELVKLIEDIATIDG